MKPVMNASEPSLKYPKKEQKKKRKTSSWKKSKPKSETQKETSECCQQILKWMQLEPI